MDTIPLVIRLVIVCEYCSVRVLHPALSLQHLYLLGDVLRRVRVLNFRLLLYFCFSFVFL